MHQTPYYFLQFLSLKRKLCGRKLSRDYEFISAVQGSFLAFSRNWLRSTDIFTNYMYATSLK